ncbi:MAG: integrase core domain-containing protein [bacterium]
MEILCIVHSDQGSEYRSEKFTSVLKYHQISQSMSPKGCPWRNGFQESYYRGFKEDLGDISCSSSVGEVVSRLRETIDYYNNERIHTALKASPNEFLATYYQKTA